MKTNKKNKKKIKKIIIVGIILIIIIGIIIIKASFSKNETDKMETEVIEKRSLAQSISATGVITTSTTKNVTSTLNGLKITSVKVKEGDKISVGDVICTFDTSDISTNLASLQKSASVAQAQSNLSVQSAQRNLNDAIANKDSQLSVTQSDVDKAQRAYQDSQNQLNVAKNNLTNQQNSLNAYMQTYNTALAKYNTVKGEYEKRESTYNNASNVYNAQISTFANDEKAYNQYFRVDGGITNQLDPISGSIIDPTKYEFGSWATETHQIVATTYENSKNKLVSLENSLNSAKSNYLNYKGTYDTATATFTPISEKYKQLSNAVSNVQNGVSTLEKATSQLKATYDGTVNAYNTAVSASNSSISGLQDALKNSELAASISTQTQQNQITAYQKQIEEGNLKSSVSGTVTSVNVKNGDIYTGTTIAVIEGCEQFIVESEIDEYDIADIEVGMKVLVKTDATRDEELEGRIIYAAPSATKNAGLNSAGVTSGNATYKVQIELNSQNDRLRLGMNAKLSIITDSRENVWSVPYETVNEREDGTKYILISKNKETQETEEIDVETGLVGSYYIEIISDKLRDGMEVVLPKVDTSDSVEALIEAMGAGAGV